MPGEAGGGCRNHGIGRAVRRARQRWPELRGQVAISSRSAKTVDLAAGCGCNGVELMVWVPSARRFASKAASNPASPGVDQPIVGQRHRRNPAFGDSRQHHRPHQLGEATPAGPQPGQIPRVVIEQCQRWPVGPSASAHWVQSDCQHSLGRAKENRLVADSAACGAGPRSALAGQDPPYRRARWHAIPSRCSVHTIDCGPWSSPASMNCLRLRSTASSTAAPVCPGEKLAAGTIPRARQDHPDKAAPPFVERRPTDLLIAAKPRDVLHLPGQRRRGTNIHRRHLLGHGPSWSRPHLRCQRCPETYTCKRCPETAQRAERD